MLSKPARPLTMEISKRGFATAKLIHRGAHARGTMLRGWDTLADAVAATLGPKGRNVVIEQAYGPPKVTKDGVTVAKAILLPDKVMNVGAQIAKQVASRTNDLVGDGTTTATVLGRAIYREGCKAVAAGMNPMDVKRGIDRAVDVVLADLTVQSTPISTTEEVRNVATIAANADQQIGDLLAEAFEKVGREGTITLQDGKTLFHELEVVEGCKFDRGYLSHYFVSNTKESKIEMESPLILFYEKKLSSLQPLLPLLEKVLQAKKSLLIIAEDVEGEALTALVVNKLRGALDVAAVKAPGFGDTRTAMLQDLAILTGGQVITEQTDNKLEDVELQHLGTAKTVTITKDSTTVLEGASSAAEVEDRCEQLRGLMENTVSEYEKDKLKERLAKLKGGVAVLRAGGASEVEVNEAKDRMNDALSATRCAIEEGIVAGGGAALLYASTKLTDALAEYTKTGGKNAQQSGLKIDNFDQSVGVRIVAEAVRKPCQTIVNNAGDAEGSVVVQTLLEGKDKRRGYNAQTGKYVDMLEAGIVDPTKVVRTALADASSVAGLLTTTEIVISEAPDTDQLSPMDKRAMSRRRRGVLWEGYGQENYDY